MQTFDSAILDVIASGEHLFVRTQESIYVDTVRVGPMRGDVVGLTRSRGGRVLAVAHDARRRTIELAELGAHGVASQWAHVPTLATQVSVRPDGLFTRAGARLCEIELRELAGGLVPTVSVRARVLPHATTLFDGVALQRIEGGVFASLLRPRTTPQLRLHELEGIDIVDAGHAGNTLVVLGTRQGRLDLWVFGLDPEPRHYRVHHHPDVDPFEIAWAPDVQGGPVWATPLGVSGERTCRPHPDYGPLRPVALGGLQRPGHPVPGAKRAPVSVGWVAGRVLYREQVSTLSHQCIGAGATPRSGRGATP